MPFLFRGVRVLPWLYFHVNRHACPLQAPRMMKDDMRGGAPLPEVGPSFGALTPHVNRTQATNPHPELLPLSTHSN